MVAVRGAPPRERPGPGLALPKTGPGAHLRYLAGGAGGNGLPGSAAWRTALGLFWSHEYAQRMCRWAIVPS